MVWKVKHEEFESSIACDDGIELRASLVVDASGFASTFTEYDKPRNNGYQIAHGILVEVDHHPFDLDKMVLMDWRDSHMGNEPCLRANNSKVPTFLYAMPFDSNFVFLEETSLVSMPLEETRNSSLRGGPSMSQLLMLGKSVIFNCNKAQQEEIDGDIVDIDWPEDSVEKAKMMCTKARSMTGYVEAVSNSFITGRFTRHSQF
ncbi:hypothetical protein OIU78_014407 [Salix suchowensis]|nr:hypothetical protein OIU78_014407 [Salix suchowensis]